MIDDIARKEVLRLWKNASGGCNKGCRDNCSFTKSCNGMFAKNGSWSTILTTFVDKVHSLRDSDRAYARTERNKLSREHKQLCLYLGAARLPVLEQIEMHKKRRTIDLKLSWLDRYLND